MLLVVRKVVAYVGWTLLALVVALGANLLLSGLCMQPGTNPCG